MLVRRLRDWRSKLATPQYPRLLVSDDDLLRLVDLDTDRVTDLLTEERVIDLAADVREQRLFLLTADNDILSLDLHTLTKHKVACRVAGGGGGTGLGLAESLLVLVEWQSVRCVNYQA